MGFIRNNTFGRKWILFSLIAVLMAGTAWAIVHLDDAAVDVTNTNTIGVKGIAVDGIPGATVDATFTWDTNALGFILNLDSTLALREPTNVFIPQTELISTNYKFFHNSASPDGTKMFLAVNRADAPQGATTGEFDLYMLDAAEFEKGNVVVLNKNTIGAPGLSGTTFRSNWSKDGTTIALAGAARLWLIDAGSLQSINGPEGYAVADGENHDAMFTEDGKYVIMTLRTKPHAPPNDAKMDGALQLYDVASGTAVGGVTSICNSCHNDPSRSSVLCGIDGVVSPNGDGTYSGRVFVAGHGGHVAGVNVEIDPSNTTAPITGDATAANTLTAYIQVNGAKHANGSSQYKLHDVRLDGDPDTGTLYWSTYNLDANSQLHYGNIDLATSFPKTVTDHVIDPDPAVTMPSIAPDAMPFYCGSAQTETAHIPVTMTYPAYFTVIPKGSE